MRILHTSDWHLGRLLYGTQRYSEFDKFLNWLLETINKESIDILLVSGDVFDTTTPGNRAQELYYSFLYNISLTKCRHIIITSGNHDSPSFLNAPKEILKHMNIHIVTSGCSIEEEVILLKNRENQIEAIICAVPYLRDRDIRLVDQGESPEDKNFKLVNGIKSHYLEVCNYALNLKEPGVPIIAMGHLFAAGAKTMDGDGVRDLYVGSLSQLGGDIFPDFLDYVALGHLHIPQKIAGSDFIRYSGSPLPMGFGEANQKKLVIIIDIGKNTKTVTEITIPTFQKLIRITGDKENITTQINTLKDENSNAWLEIEFNGDGLKANVRDDVFDLIKDTQLEVRVIKNSINKQKVLDMPDKHVDLDELNVTDVFNRCLDIYNIDEKERPLLNQLYNEIIKIMTEEDVNL